MHAATRSTWDENVVMRTSPSTSPTASTRLAATSRSGSVRPGRAAPVESTSARSTPRSPRAFSPETSVGGPRNGSAWMRKSPECTTTPQRRLQREGASLGQAVRHGKPGRVDLPNTGGDAGLHHDRVELGSCLAKDTTKQRQREGACVDRQAWRGLEEMPDSPDVVSVPVGQGGGREASRASTDRGLQRREERGDPRRRPRALGRARRSR